MRPEPERRADTPWWKVLLYVFLALLALLFLAAVALVGFVAFVCGKH